MNRRYYFLFLFLILFFSGVNSQDIRIGLFQDKLVKSFTFHCINGVYNLSDGNNNQFVLKQGDILFIRINEKEIKLNNGISEIGSYQKLLFHDAQLDGKFSIKLIDPVFGSRNYSGDLEVEVKHQLLSMILRLDFEKYLAGVVETEAGPGAPYEFFKAQSVLCRTYALKYWNKHLEEGFNLCDNTHCQAFNGVSDQNPEIQKAVMATYKLVVTDQFSDLIIPVFHSNSGGETQRASSVWPTQPDYLQAMIDPFSKDQPNYSWQKSINVNDWIAYLESKNISVKDAGLNQLLIRQEHRKANFILNNDTLSLAQIRNDLGLRSGFFSMFLQGDKIIINGKGYGHGIGLSQEGAMEMAREGYDFRDILRYYYFNVLIKNMDDIPQRLVPKGFE
jgi:stage II sporulation protein D (peptidoglycan lytic transglycosylase)